jgi:hypothetical protein
MANGSAPASDKPATKTDQTAADKKKLAVLEDDIAILEKERDLARNTLGDETLYKDTGRLKAAQQTLFDIEQALRVKTTEWEALVERIG